MRFSKKYISVPTLTAAALMMAVAAPFVRPALETAIVIEPPAEPDTARTRYPVSNPGQIPT